MGEPDRREHPAESPVRGVHEGNRRPEVREAPTDRGPRDLLRRPGAHGVTDPEAGPAAGGGALSGRHEAGGVKKGRAVCRPPAWQSISPHSSARTPDPKPKGLTTVYGTRG